MSQQLHTFGKDFGNQVEITLAIFQNSGYVHTQWPNNNLVVWDRTSDGHILRTVYSAPHENEPRHPISHIVYAPDGNEVAREYLSPNVIQLRGITFMRISKRATGWAY